MNDNFEVFTTHDKSRRDQVFADLRANGNELEKQAVKFSGCDQILLGSDRPDFFIKRYGDSPKAKCQVRFIYMSTWSVAYPRT